MNDWGVCVALRRNGRVTLRHAFCAVDAAVQPNQTLDNPSTFHTRPRF